MIRPLALLLFWTAACSPMGKQAEDFASWHEKKRETEIAVAAELNREGGADYPRAIAIMEGSGWPRPIIDLEVGNIILSAHRDGSPAKMPSQAAVDGIARLERAAGSNDAEAASTAPEHLRLWFERGAGTALPPSPPLAACWQRVAAKAGKAAECIALRAGG